MRQAEEGGGEEGFNMAKVPTLVLAGQVPVE
jgi:hypothetical protein